MYKNKKAEMSPPKCLLFNYLLIPMYSSQVTILFLIVTAPKHTIPTQPIQFNSNSKYTIRDILIRKCRYCCHTKQTGSHCNNIVNNIIQVTGIPIQSELFTPDL